jgi:hypothetical protein
MVMKTSYAVLVWFLLASMLSCSAAADLMNAAGKEASKYSLSSKSGKLSVKKKKKKKKHVCGKACSNSAKYGKRVLGAGSTGKCRAVCKKKLGAGTQKCLAKAKTRAAFVTCLQKGKKSQVAAKGKNKGQKQKAQKRVVVGSGKGATIRYEAMDDTILLPAKSGVVKEFLGRALTVDLKESDSTHGGLGRAFPYKVKTSSNEADCQFKYEEVSDHFRLKANANYLVASGGASADTSSRYWVYRAFCIDKVDVLQINKKGLKPVGQGYLTPIKIYYGWSLDAVVSGSKSTFTANVQASLPTWGAGLEAYASMYGLNVFVKTRGLKSKGNSVPIVQSFKDIGKVFQKSGKPSPILVEYMATRDFEAERIFWKSGNGKMKKGKLLLSLVEFEVNPKKVKGSSSGAWDTIVQGPAPDTEIRLEVYTNNKWFSNGMCACKYNCKGKCSSLKNKAIDFSKSTKVRFIATDKDVGQDDYIGTIEISHSKLLKLMNGKVTQLSTKGTQIAHIKVKVVPQID